MQSSPPHLTLRDALADTPLLRQSTTALLQLAASVCRARFAVLYLEAGEVIANDPAALVSEATRETVASVPLVDGAGIRGTLVVADTERRQLTGRETELLEQIGAQLLRSMQTEALFRASAGRQLRLQTLLDDATVGMYLIENDRFTYVNRRFADVLGYTKEEILALGSVRDLVVEQQHDVIDEMVRRRNAGDHARARYVIQVRCRDGSVLETEVHSSVATIDGSRVVIGAAVDVTARSQVTRRIEEREEYFRALTENVLDVIAILDPEGRTSYVSPSVTRILGYEPEELTGKTHFALVHPGDRDRVVAAFERLATGLGPHVSETYRLRHKDGGWRVLDSIGTNLLEHPQIRGLVLNTRDVTDRKLLEQEVEQLNRLTSIGRLAAQVAHEFNNVLMGIQPLVDILRHEFSHDPKRLRIADLIAASIARGKRITTDVLRFGRPAQPDFRVVDAKALVSQAADEIRPMLPDGIALEIDAADAPMYVEADRAQLSQVLINLALNARDAMSTAGGTLTIAVRPGHYSDRRHRFIELTVSDTGEGIAREDLPYIFEPLFTTKRCGTGLGLSVVFQIAAAHRGHVSVESERGKGSTFQVYIPAAAADAVPDHPVEERRAASPERKLRVLLVDDDEAVVEGLQWVLEAEGVDVTAVGLGRDVLPAVAALRPDVIVLDLSLPDGDGREVYKRVSAQFDIPVVFSTGHLREHEVEQLVDGRQAALLMKPYSTSDLLRTIAQVVGAKETVR